MKLSFDNKISAGHIAQLVALLAVGIAGFYEIRAETASVRSEAALARQLNLSVLSQAIQKNQATVDAMGKITETQLIHISVTMRRLETRIRDLSRRPAVP